MAKAALIERFGDPEVFFWRDVDVGRPGPGEARVRHTAIGLNWADLRYREGGDSHYPVPSLPAIIGLEAAGVVEEVGKGVEIVAPGDRVAYGALPLGAYAEARVIAADDLYRLPDGVSDEQAGAIYIKGLTAQYLADRAYPISPGETVLVHAAAGGVGMLLCQIAKHYGATVIGTAGGAEKVAYAEAHGCDHAIDYQAADFEQVVKDLLGDHVVDVVYDSVGLATFEKSLNLLRPRGMMVSFGHASGKVPPLDIVDLAHKGSLYLTRCTGRTYNTGRKNFVAQADALFGMVAGGTIQAVINQRYALSDAAQAHHDMAARKTLGLSVLIP